MTSPTYSGTITYIDADTRSEQVKQVAEVPEALRFGADASGVLVPVVKVVAQARGEAERVIREYGPAGQQLRMTVQRRS
jgi:hypothetical protein